MSADELRRAAATLRERANAAQPGPWESGERCVWSHADIPDGVVVGDAAGGGGVYYDADGAYIATVHPGVGLALADWLDHYASVLQQQHPIAFADDAIALARLINGGAA
jgi:hypothetical protein